jgi:hypothetical protein
MLPSWRGLKRFGKAIVGALLVAALGGVIDPAMLAIPPPHAYRR